MEREFGDDVDYAVLVKHYGPDARERRYSPTVTGYPDYKHVSARADSH